MGGVDFSLNLRTETVDQTQPGEPLCLPSHASTREAMEKMRAENQSAVLVCDNGLLVGIFTERDALKMMARNADFDAPLEKVMVRKPVAIGLRETVGEAISKMSQGGYRRLPIVDEQGRPTGLLKVEGILHYLVEHFPSVVYNLPPEPHHATHDREGA